MMLLTAVVAGLLAAPRVFAASSGFLQHMPSVAEVEQKVHGANADDTEARKFATYLVLQGLILELSEASAAGGRLSTEELALQDQYVAPCLAHKAKASPKTLQRYPENNPKFRSEVIELFSLGRWVESARARAAPPSAAAPTDSRTSSRLGAIAVTAFGALMIFGGIAGMVGIARENRKIREAEFHRRTAGGAVAFHSFNEADALRTRKKASDLAGVACVAFCLLGMALAALGALMVAL